MPASVVRCSVLSESGFFSSAQRVFLIVVACSARPLRRNCPASPRRTWSRALVAQATTWNGSRHNTARGARSATTVWIQSAPSALTWVSAAARSAPSWSKNRRSVSWVRSLPAHTSRPVS
jgi:hypothetical protein